jgi:cytochrome P450
VTSVTQAGEGGRYGRPPVAHLPPGPRSPRSVQTLAWWTRSIPLFERCRARYGKRFTLHLLQTPPGVHLSDPDEIKEVFTAPADVLHPGEGARILEPVVGANSVILLDEGAHLSQRKLMLPAFHGERMAALTGLLEEVTEREVASWPLDTPVELHPRLQALTLEVILRAVFGLDPGSRLESLRDAFGFILEFGNHPASMFPLLQRGERWKEYVRSRAAIDALLFELIDERRADPSAEERDDVLAMLLAARHEDGSQMCEQELRDELMTLLVAGHETTASELAWAFERLARAPDALASLLDEVDSDSGDDYLTATIHETLRHRPVIPNAAPRLTKRPVTIGGFDYPEGVVLMANAYLVHHDPEIYPDPYAFRPERFLGEKPGTYTWIPFGGGRRRCLGASFALLEMKVVLRAVLSRAQPAAAPDVTEGSRRRSITLSPRRSAVTVLRARARDRVPVAA